MAVAARGAADGMSRIIGIVVFVPCAVVLGIFAVENRTPLSLEIWPLAGPYEMWASVWILGLLAVGVLVGLFIGWFSTIAWRRRAWKAERQNRALERKLEERTEPAAADREAESPDAALPAPARPARTALLED